MKALKNGKSISLTCFSLLFSVPIILAQGTFQNLDFEAANLPVIPSGQFGGLVSTSDAIPAWTAYYGITQTSQILHNNYSLGDVNISILGPNWNEIPLLQGSYSVLLQSGLVASTTPTPAGIGQTGTVPPNAKSLQFFSRQIFGPTSAHLEASFNGQNLSLVPLSSSSSYTVYGADVSAFSGITGELIITSPPNVDSHYNSFLIDSITFSIQAIPEPSTAALLVLGATVIGISWRRREKCPSRLLWQCPGPV